MCSFVYKHAGFRHIYKSGDKRTNRITICVVLNPVRKILKLKKTVEPTKKKIPQYS